MAFNPTAHPVLALPSLEQAMELGSERFAEVMARRERIIREERLDPFGKGWEPPIWKVCDALLGFPWVDAGWAERMRRHLGFEAPVQVLLINGGNRAGKSEYAAKRVMRVLRMQERARGWALHSKAQMSRDYQQPLFWKYMDPQLRGKPIMSQTTYIAYKMKTGFSEDKFVLPNLSDMTFLNYEMERDAVEGGNLDVIWADELVPPDWVETMELRIAEKEGRMLVTFTPVAGFSETVRLFQDGAETVQECTAYLCPRDGGAPDIAGAVGLTEEEYAEVQAAAREKRASRCPQSRPENCEEWLEEEGGAQRSARPTGREFERVPRVMKCAEGDTRRAVVFFYSSDNPYGNPKGVWGIIHNKAQDFVKERWYGLAQRTMTARFPKFNEKVHVVAPGEVPAQGTNYHKVDPSSGRNFFMLWFRVTPEHVYVYREWPGSYYIPGVGVPGPWALPDGKKKDGRPGPAQHPFGFGNLRYKYELARLEQWKDFARTGRDINDARDGNFTEEERRLIKEWDETNGGREPIQTREMDVRFASVPKNENDRPRTLMTDFEDILVFFDASPAGEIADRIQKINDALDYDESRPVDFYNKPRLLISSECRNLIYSLRTWTNEDGQKGACKDPIDVLGWFFEGDNPYLGQAGPAPDEEGEDTEQDIVEEYLGKQMSEPWMKQETADERR